MADQQTDSRDQDDESAYEFLARRRRTTYLTTAALVTILLGIACIVLPLLPAQSAEQRASDPTVLFVVGPLLIIVGTLWLVKRIQRDGF